MLPLEDDSPAAGVPGVWTAPPEAAASASALALASASLFFLSASMVECGLVWMWCR